MKRGKFEQRHTGRTSCVDGGKHWNDASRNQETPRISGNHQNLGRGKKVSSLGAFRKNMTLLTPLFWISSLKN